MKRKGHMNRELLVVAHNHIASQDVDMEHHRYQIQVGLEMAHPLLRKIEVTDHIQQEEVLASFSV
jgi:predicted ABC-type ATPase